MRCRAVFAAAILALPGPPAAAVAPSACGGSWTTLSSSSCGLIFAGLPLTVSGRAAGAVVAGLVVTLSVDVSTPPPVNTPRTIVLACVAVSYWDASCSASLGPDVADPIGIGVGLRCEVRGFEHGTFACSSGPA